MDRIELLRLMLGDLQHLHGQNAEAILLELLDDVSDRVFLHASGFTMVRCVAVFS